MVYGAARGAVAFRSTMSERRPLAAAESCLQTSRCTSGVVIPTFFLNHNLACHILSASLQFLLFVVLSTQRRGTVK